MGTETEETSDVSLGERPEADPLARQVALARVQNALLGIDAQVKIGRYHVLERAGAGGMGVVYAAWDPDLDRRVAIKLMRVEMEAKRERALAEGQALAKLSHPNVVAVHDVGVLDDEQLYLVMEWVRGKSLRTYCDGKSVREIVRAYHAAGEGLTAAHAAGIVHRDFKPENVMVGDDGRVRVVDFGLALAEGGEGNAAGTPRYMPPEQQRGEAVTAAADQYAFCVALREALGTVPAWIEKIVARGTAAEPAARFPNMPALLRALSHDPRTVWRRRLLAGGAVAMTGVAFVVGLARGGEDHCTGAPAELARSWGPAQRAKVVAHLKQLGEYGVAEAERIAKVLDEYGDQWIAAHHGACTAHERSDVTNDLYERGLGCLARARVSLETAADVLTTVPTERLQDAIVASHGLPEVDRCLSDAAASPVAPPAKTIASQVETVSSDIAKASVLVLAGDPQAASVAQSAAVFADKLAYAPLVARAQIVLGSALAVGKPPDALVAYDRAIAAAIDGNDDVAFVEAFARKLFVAGRTKEGAGDVVASLPMVSRVAERTKTLGSFPRALLYNNAGTTRLAAGDTAGAHTWFEQARAVPQPGKLPIELWAVLGNLASTTDDANARAKLFREQREHLEAELGPNHLFTLQERVRSMQFTANGDAVMRELDELCHALVRWHPQRIDKIEPCAYELAVLARTLDDTARESEALALISEEGKEPRNRLAHAEKMFMRGDPIEAKMIAARVADEQSKQPQWWARFWAVEGWLLVAHVDAKMSSANLEAAQQALAMLSSPGFDLRLVYLQRRVAAAHAFLAKQSPEHAEQAATWYRQAGGYDALLKGPDLR